MVVFILLLRCMKFFFLADRENKRREGFGLFLLSVIIIMLIVYRQKKSHYWFDPTNKSTNQQTNQL